MNQPQRPIIYQIFLRLFGNCKTLNPVFNGSRDENGCGGFSALSAEVLQFLADKGFTHIWLTGIIRHATKTDYSTFGFPAAHPDTVKGMAGSPYAISDFFELDPDLAERIENRWSEFEECKNRIHAAGLKLIVDFVPNHTARQYSSPTAQVLGLADLGQKDDNSVFFSPQNNYYYLPGEPLILPQNVGDEAYIEYPAKATGNDCFSASPSIFDWYETIKLNYGHHPKEGVLYANPVPNTWIYMKEVLRFWAKKGVDGFRCDMVELVPVPFWNWLLPALSHEFPHLIFIAEVYNPDRYPEFLAAGFHFLYDKVGLYDALVNLLLGKGAVAGLMQVWQKQEGYGERMLRFLENHDEVRLASKHAVGDAKKVVPAWATLCLMSSGPIMLYMAQELGEKAEGAPGYSGDDGKTTIFDYYQIPTLSRWLNNGKLNKNQLTDEEADLQKRYFEILKLASSEPAFSDGSFYDLQFSNQQNPNYPADTTYAFLRFQGSHAYLAIQSFSSQENTIRIIIPEHAWQLMGINTNQFARLMPVFSRDAEVGFFVRTSFESEGQNPGILVKLNPHAYPVWKIDNSR